MLRVPLATYRLQLTKDFNFADAAALVPYLSALGISHLYASPFLEARPGSSHGYDIVNHNKLNPELGGVAGFEHMSATLKVAGMGLILDFVPNHMGVGFSDNAWWLDVLEWGQKSRHAASFDIDWNGLPYREKPGVLLPILGRPYGDALNAGEIELRYDGGAGTFAAWYFDQKLPINPQRYDEIIRTAVAKAAGETTQTGRRLLEVMERYRGNAAPSYNEAPALKKELSEIEGADTVIVRGLASYRGDNGNDWSALHRLLERQAYHIAYWRVAFAAINYRRFFNINDLAGIRPEHPTTFHAMHESWSAGLSPKTNCRASGSIISTVCAIPPSMPDVCGNSFGACGHSPDRMDFMFWLRRSSAQTSRCRNSAASTAQPVMNASI